MTETKEFSEKHEIEQLSNELTFRNYHMNRSKVRDLFRVITIPEYIALHTIESGELASELYPGRTYLKDIAGKMQIPVRQASKMIGELSERGLVIWSHDGNGSEGTYVTITETGRKLQGEQEMILRGFYGKVIQKYGKEKFIALLQEMKKLDDVMSEEMEAVGNKKTAHT